MLVLSPSAKRPCVPLPCRRRSATAAEIQFHCPISERSPSSSPRRFQKTLKCPIRAPSDKCTPVTLTKKEKPILALGEMSQLSQRRKTAHFSFPGRKKASAHATVAVILRVTLLRASATAACRSPFDHGGRRGSPSSGSGQLRHV